MLKLLLILIALYLFVRIGWKILMLAMSDHIKKNIPQQRKEGDITIEGKKGRSNSDDSGEYVDYEEIK